MHAAVAHARVALLGGLEEVMMHGDADADVEHVQRVRSDEHHLVVRPEFTPRHRHVSRRSAVRLPKAKTLFVC